MNEIGESAGWGGGTHMHTVLESNKNEKNKDTHTRSASRVTHTQKECNDSVTSINTHVRPFFSHRLIIKRR